MNLPESPGSLWKEPASFPPLGEGEVHLWRIDLRRPPEDGLLDAAERERAAGYAAPDARRRFVATRAALRRLLGGYAERPAAALAFGEGPHRKPFLKAGGGLEFNASHTAETALLAFARGRRVGIDLERLDRPGLDLAGISGRFFSPAEAACWKAAGADRPSFFRIWARKEAVLKAEGGGWTAGGRRFSVAAFWPGGQGEKETLFWPPAVAWERGRFALYDVAVGEGFSAALAVADRPPERVLYFRE